MDDRGIIYVRRFVHVHKSWERDDIHQANTFVKFTPYHEYLPNKLTVEAAWQLFA